MDITYIFNRVSGKFGRVVGKQRKRLRVRHYDGTEAISKPADLKDAHGIYEGTLESANVLIQVLPLLENPWPSEKEQLFAVFLNKSMFPRPIKDLVDWGMTFRPL